MLLRLLSLSLTSTLLTLFLSYVVPESKRSHLTNIVRFLHLGSFDYHRQVTGGILLRLVMPAVLFSFPLDASSLLHSHLQPPSLSLGHFITSILLTPIGN